MKFISLLLAVLLMLGSLSVLSVFSASATEEGTGTGTGTGSTTDKKEEVEETIDYTTQVYETPEAKLATMLNKNGKPGPWLVKGDYELYVDAFSGEVAYRNTKTGEILFTNPYDIGTSTLGSENTKKELLSQIIIKYTDNNQSPTFVSYEMAALKDQITVKQIKNGIRVQYTLGREQARKLVPGMISVERFDEVIAGRAKENGISDFDYGKLTAYYLKLSLDGLSERGRAELIDAFPIVEKMDVYVFDQNASETEKNKIEGYIKTYCPEYTYEELDADHAETEYEAQDKNPPLFKLALEYTLDENGMTVRLPANGIRFNEQLYQLEELQVLPYMGAGNSAYDGYTFYPDGAGSLYEFDDITDTKTRTVRGKVYGTDFAYHSITGTYQQAIRYPVFGVVENTVYYDYIKTKVDSETGEETYTTTTLSGSIVDQYYKHSKVVTDTPHALVTKYNTLIGDSTMKVQKREESRGYVAIMVEGDALTDIMTYHAGSLSDYNTVKMIFNPRPSDSYNLQDSISVGSDATWTVVSERKYVGNYKIRYVMLSDSEKAEEAGVTDYYETSWMGMALAYRDYLDEGGYLTRLTANDVEKDIPLYIETFGALETTQRIMSIPVDVMTPLTTFENVQTMYDELAAAGVTNVNFKLTGYANGGMFSTVPSKLKWEKAVGGKDGFQALVNYAAEVNAKGDGSHLGIFPDFDFSYINYKETFDGVNKRQDAVKTIDDRYASYREYSATKQKHESHYQLAISPSRFNKFYEKLTANYLKYDNVNGISVSTLGNTLNSDFDEDDPYNREDSKEFVATALSYLSGLKNNQGEEIELMSEGGNAFTWKFLDHMLDVSLDSSRNNDAANAVPFVGVVLHGYVSFTGAPLNMEGNIQYAMLKAIENGASPYYILSYQNTQNLKEYELLSHYYSVRYDIWKDDVIKLYGELNGVLGDVQDKLIIDHEFWTGTRVPDSDELLDDIQSVLDSFIYDEENASEVLALKDKQAVSVARKQAREAAEAAIASLAAASEAYRKANDMYGPFLAEVELLPGLLMGNEVPEGFDHVCGENAWTAEMDALAKEQAEDRGEDYVKHECGYINFLALDANGKVQRDEKDNLIEQSKYKEYEQYAKAEKGTAEYGLYQLNLNYKTARSRYNLTVNRRLTDINTINDYYKTAEKAMLDVEKHLANAKAAVELIAATEGMLPELISESEAYRDLTDMYLYNTGFTVLLNKYKKHENKDSFTPEADAAAIDALVKEYVTANFDANKDKILEDLAAALAKADETLAKAQTTYTEKVAKAESDAAEKIAKAEAELSGDELTAELEKIDAERRKAIRDARTARVAAENTYPNSVVAAYNTAITACALTDEQKSAVNALRHFEYDYAKLYDTDLTDLAKYYAAELLAGVSEYVNNLSKPEMDFVQSSYTEKATAANALLLAVSDIMVSGNYLTQEQIDNRLAGSNIVVGPSTEEEEEIFDKYAVEEGSIVVVTYGGKNGVDYDAYKSIILNYNNFSVKVEYQGKVYTLPAYGYVVVMQ